MRREELEELLLPAEVARILRVTTRTIERYCKQGKLRAVKVGRRWRIPRSALEDFLRQGGSSAGRKLGQATGDSEQDSGSL
jgi:excisionase family DNA binding protein